MRAVLPQHIPGQDWGNTYAEVDMSAQHMWYVQNGQVVLETDVVTGEPIPSKITPEGVYSLMWEAAKFCSGRRY